MAKKRRGSSIKGIIGLILLSLGVGMFLSVVLPYCIPLAAIACIAGGTWLITQNKKC